MNASKTKVNIGKQILRGKEAWQRCEGKRGQRLAAVSIGCYSKILPLETMLWLYGNKNKGRSGAAKESIPTVCQEKMYGCQGHSHGL